MREPFYDTPAWRNARERILQRDGYRCQRCRARGISRYGNTVHHIEPLKQAPEKALVEDNLTTLCPRCHDQMHPERNRKGGQGLPAGVLVVKV